MRLEIFINIILMSVLPKSKEYYDAGQFDEVIKIAVTQNATQNIRAFQSSFKEYTRWSSGTA